MALVKWSALIAEMRGKLNGTVLARNRYAAYARNKVTPHNPQTVAQQKIRTIFAQFSSKWRTLQQEERDAWNLAVNDFLKTNIFGDVYKPSGLNLYMRINMNLYNIGRNPTTLPPIPVPVDALKIIVIKMDAINNLFLAIVQSTPSINNIPTVSVPRPLSAGINFVKSELRMIKYNLNPVPGFPDRYEINLGAQYANKYGNLYDFIGQNTFIKITPIDVATGINGVSLQEKVIIH